MSVGAYAFSCSVNIPLPQTQKDELELGIAVLVKPTTLSIFYLVGFWVFLIKIIYDETGLHYAFYCNL